MSLVKVRGEAMAAAAAQHPGVMLAVLGLDADAVGELCRSLDAVWPANFNCPGQVVVSCAADAAPAFEEAAKAAGARRVVRLAVSGAFHSPLVAAAAAALHGPLAGDRLGGPQARLSSRPAAASSSATASPPCSSASSCRRCVSSSRYAVCAAEGYNAYLEVGPGAVLTGLVRRIDREAVAASAGDIGTLAAALAGGWATTGEAHR